jgi:hypothetical protein
MEAYACILWRFRQHSIICRWKIVPGKDFLDVTSESRRNLVIKMLGQKKAGYFIDLAENDPNLSNSCALETQRQHVWKMNGSTACIDGNPCLFWMVQLSKV